MASEGKMVGAAVEQQGNEDSSLQWVARGKTKGDNEGGEVTLL